MGIELARMFVRIRGDSTRLPEDFAAAKATAESNMRDIADSMAGIFYKAKGIRAYLEKGIRGATEYEQTVTEFETLIGSAEETKKTLENLTSFAVQTPFEMPQLLGVTRGLLNFGERGQQLMGTLKMLGDVSQGNAQKFGLLGLVFNQIRGVGKLTREDFKQLSTRGVISLQDIAKHYGTTDAAADAMLTHGKIKFEDFRKILEKTTQAGGKNYDAMKRQSTTLGGLNSTLSDAINITARLLAEPLMPYLKALTTVQIKVVEGFSSIVQKMGAASSGMAVGAAATSALGLALTSASLAARFFGISIRSAIIGTGIGAVLLVMGSALGGIVMWIAEAVTKTAGWKATLASLSKAWEVLYDAAATIAASLGDIWEALFGASLVDSIGMAAEYIAGLIKSIADWVVSVKSTFIEVGEGIAYFFRNIGNLVQISLIDSLLYVMDIVPQIEGIYQGMAIGFGALWAGAEAFFKAWVSNIVGGLTEIKNLAAAVWEAVKAGFEAAFDSDISVADAMKEAFIKTLAEQKDAAAALNPFEEWKKAAKEARDELKAGFAEEGGAKGALEKKRQELLAAIEASEEARRNRGAAGPPVGEGEKKKEGEKGKPDLKIEAGRFGFEAFGSKFQDALLKAGENDQQKKMVGLMEQGNAVQDQLLIEAKKKKGGLAP